MRSLFCLVLVLSSSVAFGQNVVVNPAQGYIPQPPMVQQGLPPMPPPMMTDPITSAGNVLATNPDGIEIRDSHVDTKTVRRLTDFNQQYYQNGYQQPYYNQVQPYYNQGYQQPYYNQGYNQGYQQPYYNQSYTNNQPFFWNGFWWMRDGYHLWYLNRCSGSWCLWQ